MSTWKRVGSEVGETGIVSMNFIQYILSWAMSKPGLTIFFLIFLFAMKPGKALKIKAGKSGVEVG